MSSDELGEHGDAQFRLFCTEGKLIANKSGRDRTGWDYRVELPNSSLDSNQYFDKRQVPLPFMFQIKSMWSKNSSFSAPIVSMERLTKLLDPAFVFVVRFNKDRVFHDAFVIHMVGDNLNKVLKRLAVASSTSQKISNRRKISFSKNVSWQRVTNGNDLVEAISRIARTYTGAVTYQIQKEKELREAGYDASPLTLNIRVDTKSEDELIEGFWGLRPLPVLSVESFEKRFGIKRPVPFMPAGPGLLHVKIEDERPCRLHFRIGRFGLPLVRTCSARPPIVRSAGGGFRLLLVSDPLQIDVRESGSFHLKVSDLGTKRMPLAWWRETFRLLEMLGHKDVCIELYTEKGQKLYGGAANAAPFEPRLALGYGRAVKAVETISQLLSMAGEDRHDFSVEEIFSATSKAVKILAMLTGVSSTFSARLEFAAKPNLGEIGSDLAGVLCDVVSVGPASVMFGLAGRMALNEDSEGWVLEGKIEGHGFVEPGGVEDIDRFADDVAKRNNAHYKVVGGLSTELGKGEPFITFSK